eukprot:COSAG05_NODE_10381_length_568_cov_1.309168_2_plen_41_part_01
MAGYDVDTAVAACLAEITIGQEWTKPKSKGGKFGYNETSLM